MNDSPYVGPRPFRRNEARLFYGRAEQARAIRDDWLSERVTVLHGPMASGKTSLLNAGVLPLLARESEVTVLSPGRLVHPSVSLASGPEHNGYVYTLLSDWAVTDLPPVETTVAGFLSSWAAGDSDSGRLLVAVDQFEEIFTAFPARAAERADLFEQLATALSQIETLNLLLVVRDDHLSEVASLAGRLRAPFNFERLQALTPEQAAEAITGPLSDTGRSITDQAVSRLVDRLCTVVYTDRLGQTTTLTTTLVEPLYLQILANELWSTAQRRQVSVIDATMVTDDDPAQAIRRFYDTTVHDVSLNATGALGLGRLEAEERIRTWLESTFITENGTRGTAFRGLNSTADMPNLVADDLTDHHLLTARAHMRGTWLQLGQDLLIEVVHQANQAWFAIQRRTPAPAPGSSASDVASPQDFAAAAETALSQGDFARARRFASLAAERYAQRNDQRRQAQALTLRGDIALLEGDLPAAEQSFREAFFTFAQLDDNTSLARTLSALAEVSMARDDYAGAEDLYRQAVDRRRTDAGALTGLGFALWRQGLVADADAVFGQALNWQATAARALAGRGQVRVELRRHDQALADLDAALALGLTGVDEIDARSARAVALSHLGRSQEAQDEIDAALRADPARALTIRRGQQISTLGPGSRPGR